LAGTRPLNTSAEPINACPVKINTKVSDSDEHATPPAPTLAAMAIGSRDPDFRLGIGGGTFDVSVVAPQDDSIGSGRVGVGGFAPHPTDKLDATITRFRA
jgi:hypothetical protein